MNNREAEDMILEYIMRWPNSKSFIEAHKQYIRFGSSGQDVVRVLRYGIDYEDGDVIFALDSHKRGGFKGYIIFD